MKAGQTIEHDVPVQFALRIQKVNPDTREVEGVATQEVVDVHGEVVDHEAMKAVLADWPGNIREMHQPIAVGKAVKVESDDEAKATIVRSRISKGAPDTWEKVLDGTLNAYSIGGIGKKVTTKKADGSEEKRIFMTKMSELSLVDNPACPTAKFEIVKSVDGQSVECQPEEPAEETKTAAAEPLATLQAQREKFASHAVLGPLIGAVIAKLATLPADQVEKRSYPETYDIGRALSCIACLQELIESEWYQTLYAEDAGDNVATQRAQLAALRAAVELVMGFLASEFAAQFDETASIENVARAAVVGAFEKAGARHSKADVSMIQSMHDTAITLGAACLEKACEKCATTEKAAGTETPAEPAEKAADAGQAGTGEAIAADPESQADKVGEAVQEAPAAPVVAAAGLTPDAIQKLIADSIATEVQKVQEASATRIADLEGQVKKLAEAPAPGGPVTRAVQKSLGGASAPEADAAITDADVDRVIDHLSKHASTAAERDQLAQLVLRRQYQTGAGATVMTQRIQS